MACSGEEVNCRREAIDWMISVVQLVEDPQYADEDIIDVRMRLKNV
jgi:hypothetical protein